MKKEFRVLKNYEFSSIIQNRQFVKSSSFVCYFQKRKLDHARVGISVGKKLGNAVCRNKVKRQLRSIVDDIFTFEEGYDLIIIVRPAYANKLFEENKNEMKENQISGWVSLVFARKQMFNPRPITKRDKN